MPLRLGSNDVQVAVEAAEPIVASRPPADGWEEGESFRSRQPRESKPERGTLILKIIIGGIFAYAAAVGLGIVGMMFPRETHDVVRAVNQAVAFVRPDPPKTRPYVAPIVPAAETPAPSRPSAPAAPRKRPHKVSSSQLTYEVVDPTRKHVAPRTPSASITISVATPKSVGQTAN